MQRQRRWAHRAQEHSATASARAASQVGIVPLGGECALGAPALRLSAAARRQRVMIERLEKLHVAVEERVNLKRVHRRLQALAKLLIVTTFIEDALRVLTTFSVQQQSMEIAGWSSPALHTLLPALSFAVQSIASIMVVLPSSSRRPEVGCYMLICWCAWHPIMYGQQRNWEFVLETATIMGGLLILLSHFMLLRPSVLRSSSLLPRSNESASSAGELQQRAARLQAFGRVLIVSIFVYIAADKVRSRDDRFDEGTCRVPSMRHSTVAMLQSCPSAPPAQTLLLRIAPSARCSRRASSSRRLTRGPCSERLARTTARACGAGALAWWSWASHWCFSTCARWS